MTTLDSSVIVHVNRALPGTLHVPNALRTAGGVAWSTDPQQVLQEGRAPGISQPAAACNTGNSIAQQPSLYHSLPTTSRKPDCTQPLARVHVVKCCYTQLVMSSPHRHREPPWPCGLRVIKDRPQRILKQQNAHAGGASSRAACGLCGLPSTASRGENLLKGVTIDRTATRNVQYSAQPCHPRS